MMSRDPSDYKGQPLCPRCGDGWPICVSKKPDGSRWTHAETCALYQWADDLCGPCAEETANRKVEWLEVPVPVERPEP